MTPLFVGLILAVSVGIFYGYMIGKVSDYPLVGILIGGGVAGVLCYLVCHLALYGPAMYIDTHPLPPGLGDAVQILQGGGR